MRLWIRGGRVVDPANDVDSVGDLLVADGKVAAVALRAERLAGSDPGWEADSILDAEGCVVCPGFVDLHCHLREPGQEEKEDIASGTAAAARGGFTTVCAMANTKPVTDCLSVVNYVVKAAAERGSVRVLPIASITRGLAGAELTEMGELTRAGVVGFSDDGKPLASSSLMRHALEYSRMFARPIIQHSEDPELAHGGLMNEGAASIRLGLKGVPAAAEVAMVARDLALAELTGGWLHVAHVSTAEAVELIRRAKQKGVRVTAEVTPHHLVLTEDWVAGDRGRWGRGLPYDTNTKVNPPLRTAADARALLSGLRDGTIDAIATDHAPHASVDKECEYGYAASGISGFETALGLLMELVRAGELELGLLIHRLTIGPARAFGLSAGSLAVGAQADVVVFDPEREWVVQATELLSRGHNTPLLGLDLRGQVVYTLVAGKPAYASEGYQVRAVAPLEAR